MGGHITFHMYRLSEKHSAINCKQHMTIATTQHNTESKTRDVKVYSLVVKAMLRPPVV